MMNFNALPDLTPRDSHILWYTSIRNPHLRQSYHDQTQAETSNAGNNNNNVANQNRPAGAGARGQPGTVPFERTSLGRLRADEAYLARRLANVSNFGSTWLKPPGVGKSLYQMREERREAEEHAEAMRREQLAADLAEAEAEAAMAAEEGDGGGTLTPGEPGVGAMMEGLQGGRMTGFGGEEGEEEEDPEDDGEVDLDDEIPDADEASGLGGYDYDDSSEEEEEESSEEAEEDDDDDEDGESDDDQTGVLREIPGSVQRQAAERLEAERQRRREDDLRQALARGGDRVDEDPDPYGSGWESPDEETQGELLEEEDLISETHQHHHLLDDDDDGAGAGMDLDMDANLDDDIPEAESGLYEHTDSDAELSSEEEEEEDEDEEDDNNTGAVGNVSFGAGRGGRAAPAARYRSSLARSDGTRNSLVDISSILSQDGSSLMMDSSPQVRHRN